MINFNSLTPQDLADILVNKTDVVFCVSQTISDTVNQPQNQAFQLGMPYMPNEVLAQILAASVQGGHEEKTRWITFIVMAYAVGASIVYKNLNNVDCAVSIKFPPTV